MQTQAATIAEWVARILAGDTTPPPDLDPDVRAALQPLIDAHSDQTTQLDGLEGYLSDLSERFLEYSAGEFQVEMPVTGDDRTDAVGLGLQMMVEELQAVTDELAVARDEALASNAAKSTFLANMSHELRTPLNAIIGYSELILDDDDGPGHVHDDVRKILNAARHLLRLISDVLDLSKVEAGKMELELGPIDLPGLVSDVADTLSPVARTSSNRLVVEVDWPHERVLLTDGMKVRQCLLNLAGNALKFTTDGTVTIRVRTTARHALLEVQDTGIGISPDRRAAIFEPFTQERADTARLHGGTGLGLAICARFATLMGGELTLASELGEGSTFTLCLPLNLSEPAPPRKEHAARTSDRSVLVVDDDPIVLELIRRHLAAVDCTVYTCSSGPEAVRRAEELQPSLITLDILMPDVDGWTTLAQLKSSPAVADIPVVMISVEQEAKRAYSLGAQDYLTKPIERARLLKVVRQYLQGPQRQVLVVDDDPDAREVATRMLQAAGFHTREAVNGVDALQRIRVDPPDLILLDLMMPVMDGFQVVNTLGEDPSFDTPVVVLTGKTIEPAERKMLVAASAAIHEKGRDLQDVLATLTQSLSRVGVP